MTVHQIAINAALLAALVAAGARPCAAQNAKPVTVQILAINDFHGNLEPPTGTDGLINQIPAGGAEYLATHVRNAVRDNPNSILVAAGDLMGASPLLSNLLHDSPTIEVMNSLQMSVTAIGNHELDKGQPELFHRIAGGCLREEGCAEGEKSEPIRYQYLAANVVRTDPAGGPFLPATAIRTVGGVKIGFIGETFEGTPAMLQAPAVKGLRFLEESAAANEAAAQLEKQGVRAIVLLLHQGGFQHPTGGRPEPNGCANFEGPLKDVVSKLSPSIQVVITGHTHVFYNCEMAGHRVTSASSAGRMLTRISLTIDPETDAITAVNANNEIVTRDVPKDPAITAIIEKYRPGAQRIGNKTVGWVSAPISRTANATGESALGDVIADVQLGSVSAPDKGGAMVAFMNLGGIRADIEGTQGPDGKRQVSFGDLFKTQPFGNQIQVRTMTGDAIRRLLEQQFQPSGNANRLLQVSAGFSYQYRLQAPDGERIVPGSILLNGRPIAAADEVRVAATEFLFSSGGSLKALREAKNPTVGPVDLDALVEYFRSHSPVAPGPQNRIVRVD